MNKKFSSTVAGASIIIIIFSLISKGLGFIREIVFANSFGLSKDFDIYLVGSVIPVVINTSIIYLGQNFFIPAYNKSKSNSEDTSVLFNSFFWLFIFGGIIISVILYTLAGSIVNLYLVNSSEQTRLIAEKIFQIFVLTIPINAGISIINAFLQAEFEFKIPAVSQLWVNLSVIILTLFFNSSFGVFVIPIGFLIGMIFQFAYLFLKVKNIVLFQSLKKISFQKILTYAKSTLLLTIVIEIISQFYMLADRYFYKSVDTGGIAALNYAQTLFLLPVSIFSIALSTAIFPKFARSFHSKQKGELGKDIISGLSMNSFIAIPVTIIFIFLGNSLISIFYQSGKFGASDTITTFNVLRFFGIGLIFYSAYSILNKVIYGIGAVKFLLFITLFGITAKVILNFLLVGIFKQDGLALSTAITYFLFFSTSFAYILFKLKMIDLRLLVKDTLLSLVNAVISFILVELIYGIIKVESFYISAFMIILFLFIYSVNANLMNQNSMILIKNAVKHYLS